MTFRDVSDNNVHKDNIEWLAGKGITEGCNPPTNDLYCPAAQVTRAQMATFLRRAYGVTLDDARAIIDEQLAEVTADLGALSEAFAGHGHGGTAPSYPGAFHVSTQAELISALNALDDGLGGTINLYGGKYRDVVVDVPDVTFRKAGRQPTFIASGGKTALHIDYSGSGAIIEPGIKFDTDARNAIKTYGLVVQADQRVQVDGAFFVGFGRQLWTNLDLDWDEAPMPLRNIGTTPNPNPGASVPSDWADWNRFDNLHAEFVYAGIGVGEAANCMGTNWVVREFAKNAIWSYTGGPGADGALIRVVNYWSVGSRPNEAHVYLQREAGARANGGCVLVSGSTEHNADPGPHYRVESSTNQIFPSAMVGGTVGFSWEGESAGNQWSEPANRTGQGGVGPPVDQGRITQQVKRG